MERERGDEHRRKANFRFQALGVAVAVIAAFLLGRAIAVEGGGLKPQITALSSFLAKHPPVKDEAFKVMPVTQGQDASVTVVRATGELPPHYHESREEVVYVVRGGGTMLLGTEKRPV